MMFSLIIPTNRSVEILSETLATIKVSNDVDYIQEIIIVNDGIYDYSTLVYKYGVKVVSNNGKGAAAARNTGARLAISENLMFWDDDILPGLNHFQRHLEVRKRFPEALVVANRFYPKNILSLAERTPFGRYKLKHEYNWLEGCELKSIESFEGLYYVNGLATFSCSVPKSVWQILGGFNENFPYAGCEDTEFGIRARKSRYDILFDEKNICYHNELDNFTLDKWLLRQARGIKGALIITELYPEGKNHPTYYLNTPIRKKDSWAIKKVKFKKSFLATKIVSSLLKVCVKPMEKLRFSDKILFRMYNAAWIGATYRSFKEAYEGIKRQSIFK